MTILVTPKTTCLKVIRSLQLFATENGLQPLGVFEILREMASHLFLSYRIDALVDRLLEEFSSDPIDPFSTRTLLVPHAQMKQWLLLEIAKRKGISMGLKILQIEQFYPLSLNSLEMFCLIYSELSKSLDPELLAYLDGKSRRLLELTEQLVSLFFSYGQYRFPSCDAVGWQYRILQKLFVDGPWRLPIQQKGQTTEPVICFGIDYLPPIYWSFLFQAPKLSVYLFSPCVEFWEDLCTDWERKNLNRYWKKQGASAKKRDQLDAYLREGPRNLANWGKIGRRTLKNLDEWQFQIEELYPPIEPTGLLKKIQQSLLSFQEYEGQADSSLQVFLTGSSRLKEIECLRDEILRLNFNYDEISVLAPDIEPYIPFIEFVFSDEIPFRTSGFDLAPQSLFRQGLIRLFELAFGRWEVEEVLTLFETPSFYRKLGWKQEKLEALRKWLEVVQIRWGCDAEHRKKILTETLGQKEYEDKGSWERGLEQLLDAIVYFTPLQINPDLLEELIAVLDSLKFLGLSREKTLQEWAHSLENAVEKYLFVDSSDEADAAALSSFHYLLLDLKKCTLEEKFPFSVIRRFLLRPCLGQMHAAQLHGVRFSSLEEGALLPAKAVFLIGMDEESFPRTKMACSLDLLKKEVPDQAEFDRYLFLQALFSAEEVLRISYGHLSADEGKPVSPSLVVQELLSKISFEPIVYRSFYPELKSKRLHWPQRAELSLPEGEVVLSISDLRQLARHPWKFFLQKVQGIYLNESLAPSFSLQKARLIRAALEKTKEDFSREELPFGLLGDVLRKEAGEKVQEWTNQLREWELDPFSLVLRQNCDEPHREGGHYVAPPLELCFDKLKVQIVGEIKQASLKGLICATEDTICGLLKIWPEALILSMTLKAPRIWMLKNGKTKELERAEESLKAFVQYYFQCLSAPSPLISEWADSLLRKGILEFEKKREKNSLFEDPIVEWILERAEIPTAQELCDNWGFYLKEVFQELIKLYPVRGKSHAAV